MSPDLIIPLAIVGVAIAHFYRRRSGVAPSVAMATVVLAVVIIAFTPDDWSRTALGTEFSLTPLSRLLLIITAGLTMMAVCLATAVDRAEHILVVALLMMGAGSAASLGASEPLVAIFGLESAYLLAMFASGNRAGKPSRPEPGLEYLVMVCVSTVSLVVAFTLIQSYAVTRDPATMRLIVPLLGVGFGILLAPFPFHFWVPPLFNRGPSAVVALVLSVATVQAVGLMVQTLSRYPWLLLDSRGSDLLLVAGVGAMLCCPVLALWQRPLARAIAYLCVGNTGFILVGLALHSPSSVAGAIWVCISQAVAVLLVLVGLEVWEAGDSYTGWERGSLSRPLGLAMVGLGVVAMIGIPPLGAFAGKWLIYSDAASASGWLLAAMLVGGALSAASFLSGLLQEARRHEAAQVELTALRKPLARPRMAASTGAALVAVLIGMGVYPGPLLAAISIAVERLSLVL